MVTLIEIKENLYKRGRVISLLIFSLSTLYSNNIENKFEYQVGVFGNEKNFINLKGEVMDFYNIKFGLEMGYLQDQKKTDFGVFFQKVPIQNILISLELGESYYNKTSSPFIGTTINYIIPKTEDIFSLGLIYRSYNFNDYNTGLFIGMRF